MPSRVYRVFKTMPYYDGGREEFSNVYRYSHPGLDNQVPQDVAVATLEAIKELEQSAHSFLIQFTRGESANVNLLDRVQNTDVEVAWQDEPGDLGTTVNPGWTPETVVMCQLRVGKKRWLRKYLHMLQLQFASGPSGLSFDFTTDGTAWGAVLNYAQEVTSLPVTVDGSTENVIYEAGNGTPAEGPMLVDSQIRNHDVKY